MQQRLPAQIVSVLGEGRQAYVTVPSKHGPHVTPELYAWAQGRLWFAADHRTLKAKVLARDPVAGIVVTSGGRSAVLGGPIELIDVRDPVGLVRRFRSLPDAARGAGSFAVRNAPDLLAFVGDTVAGRLGSRLPQPRVLFSLLPTRAALIENDDVTDAWGGWRAGTGKPAGHVPAGGQPAVVGLPGPEAVPGRWFADASTVHVAPALLSLLELPDELLLSVVVDDYTAPGPAAKQGTLLRGRGTQAGEPGTIRVEPDRLVAWDGTETESTVVA